MAENLPKKPRKLRVESASRKKIRRDLARGMAPRKIARKHGMSPQCVYAHIRNIAERERKVKEGEWFE